MANQLAIGLGPELVARLYPFLIAIDKDLRIVQLGRAMRKICLDVEPGVPLFDVLTIFRPQLARSFEALKTNNHSTFLLDSKSTGLRLRGEMVFEQNTGLVLFLGAPWFTDINKLNASGLALSDFTINDPIVDFLYMVQAKTLAMEDAKRFSDTVIKQRDELQRTNTELERANAAKIQFLANTSHELRTPLNGIIGMASLLQRSELTPKQANFVQKISQSAEMLQSVVNDILDISKIDAGKLKLENINFELARIVHDVAGVFSTTAHLKGVELVCITSTDLPPVVLGDPARLRQVISNLVGNAVKFTATGEIVVRAALDKPLAPDGSAEVRFSVSDTGIGIDPEDKAQLFQPFSQLDNSMGRRFGGTGLGLAIARQLTELMGGTIGVDSVVGSGSTFWFTAKFGPGQATLDQGSSSFDGMRVLVVDDNATNRMYLSELLEHSGSEVRVAESGIEALNLVRSAHGSGKPFDFVLLDMHMPNMTGLDVAVILAADPAFDDLAKILLTSTDVREDPRVGLARVRACLLKPVRPDLLAQCMAGARDRTHNLDSISSSLANTAPAPELPRSIEPEILVVDDNPINVEVAVNMVETMGYRSDIATTGKEAVQAILRRSYRLVLMDLQMPEMDGYEATREIRNLESATSTHTPIIAMTAHAAESDRRRALDAGLDDYLSKPVKVEVLGALLIKWLGARPQSVRRRSAAGTDAPDAPNVIDVDAFMQLRLSTGRDQPELVLKVIRLFVDDLPKTVHAMIAAHVADDRRRLKQEAHRLKPAAAMVGALSLSQICLDIEQRAHDASQDALRQLVELFTTTSKHVQHAFETWLSQTSRRNKKS